VERSGDRGQGRLNRARDSRTLGEPDGRAYRPLSDPAVRHERASRGGKSRTSIDYYVRKLVEVAPPLTAEQRDKLAALLRGPSADTAA
jgi:hypothetical protein